MNDMNKAATMGAIDRSIGSIISEANNLSASQVEQILNYQKERNVRFGEAAIALGFAAREDVLRALSQQYHYPYADNQERQDFPELVVANNPFDKAAEFFRDIRTHVSKEIAQSGPARRAIAICSANTGDGKSFFCANLAASFSQTGAKTLIVDADMRTPRQHEIFGIEAKGSGLSGILAGRCETNVIRPVDSLPSLFVLPVGISPPNPMELVQRPAFEQLLSELLMKFDVILVDTPAFVHGADARVIADKSGAAIALFRRNVTSMKVIKKVQTDLEKVCDRFYGAIVNEF